MELTGGDSMLIEPRERIYSRSDRPGAKPVFYLSAGLVKIEYNLPGDIKFSTYVQPNTVFGIEEAILDVSRIADVYAIERSQIYNWKLASFFSATETAHKLAVASIRSLSRLLRILNSEYGEIAKKSGGRMPLDNEDINEISEIAHTIEEATGIQVHQNLKRTFRNKQIVIKEGEILDHIFWILSGQAYITKKTDNKYKVLTKVGKGELLGEMSFFDKSLTSATVIADGEVQALVFTRQNFKEIFFTNSKWIKQLLQLLSRRIVNMVTKISHVEV
jgi:CRP/FNR family cyclic AMP-dependent transcriptional regulator